MDDEEMVRLTTLTSTQSGSTKGSTVASSNTHVTLWEEILSSADVVFSNRFNMLLALGPIAVVGDATGLLGPAACFACSGLALIPCAERLSFLTEQVAEHTNGTIGALLNATFGNAPELLISVAALKSGYYRVVQLAMLGSMFTNMILVFGIACLIGGFRWQVQELRTTSGNVNVLMLLLATAGLLFPAALVLTGQIDVNEEDLWKDDRIPSPQEVKFSRVNAVVMLFLYVCYLCFQLGTHKEEFDEEQAHHPARRNLVCQSLAAKSRRLFLLLLLRGSSNDADAEPTPAEELREFRLRKDHDSNRNLAAASTSDHSHNNGDDDALDAVPEQAAASGAQLSLRVGVGWLFIITLCVSAVTDVLVDTIDGFARRMKISQVFTSMVIIPFFSNVAEQVSAFIFAYRNEMDLCVGVTVGSAIQIATFVLPGSVLIGLCLDRSMTLFFHGYETACLFFGVVVVGAILQGGTTNWLVGAVLVGVYVVFASGIWFHEVEELTVDAEQFRTAAADHSNDGGVLFF